LGARSPAPVCKPVARHFGGCGVAEYMIDSIYNARDLEYLKRCGMKPEDVQRPPRSGDWHGFRPEEIPEGQRRVIVNLDTLEYIDPAKFGQVPTLAGMATLASKHRDLPILKKANQEKSADHRRRGRPFRHAVPSKAPRRR
jgi:hypothetical protein